MSHDMHVTNTALVLICSLWSIRCFNCESPSLPSELSPSVMFFSAADSAHTTTVKSTAEPSVQIGANVSLVTGSRADVSSAPHNRTDQEKLSAVRERVKQETPRVSAIPHYTATLMCSVLLEINIRTCHYVVVLKWHFHIHGATFVCPAEGASVKH